MTDAERDLLIYIATVLIEFANPDGETRKNMRHRLDRVRDELYPNKETPA